MIIQSQIQKQLRIASGAFVGFYECWGDAGAALLSLAIVFSGAFAFSTQPVEAKPSQNSSRIVRNYFVPAPPPYTPSMVPLPLVMTYVQAVTAHGDDAVVKKLTNPYSNNIFTRNQGNMPQVVQPNPYVSYDPGIETRILKRIDYFDSQISSSEKEIGNLLDL